MKVWKSDLPKPHLNPIPLAPIMLFRAGPTIQVVIRNGLAAYAMKNPLFFNFDVSAMNTVIEKSIPRYPTQKKTCAAQYVLTSLQPAIMTSPRVMEITMRHSACGLPQTSMILAYGSLKMPAMREEMTLVSAVRECLSKLLVTYGARKLTVPDVKASMNSISHILQVYQRY